MTGIKTCPMLTNRKGIVISHAPGQRPCLHLIRRKRERNWMMTRWEAAGDEEPQHPEELLEPYHRIVLQGFRTVSRPCQPLMGPPVLRYTLLSVRAWQKPPLRTRHSYGGPLGPFANGWTPSGRQWLIQRKAPTTKPNYWQRLGRPGRMS